MRLSADARSGLLVSLAVLSGDSDRVGIQVASRLA